MTRSSGGSSEFTSLASARSQPCGGCTGGCSSSPNVERRSFRGRESRRSGSGGSWGRRSEPCSLAESVSIFARCLRSITNPIRPAITSNVPANMSQCGNCHSMPGYALHLFLRLLAQRIASGRARSSSCLDSHIVYLTTPAYGFYRFVCSCILCGERVDILSRFGRRRLRPCRLT
jgi:hypothetical protein